MKVSASASAATIRLSRGVLALSAAILVALLYSVQITSAALCLASAADGTATIESQLLPDTGGDGSDCDAPAVVAVAHFASDEFSSPVAAASFKRAAAVALALLPFNATRGVPFARDNLPLFLQTARIRN